MRPFRFFFGLSLAIMIFFVVARFVVAALVIAAFLSLLFFVGRKIKNFFMRMRWEDDSYGSYHPYYRRRQSLPTWNGDMLVDYPHKESVYIPDHRIIKVQ